MLSKKETWKTPEMTAVLAALISGLLIHMFTLVNVTFNHDNVNVFFKSYGASVTSGRWFLEILNQLAYRLGMPYNLPWANGFIFLAYVAVTAGFAVSAFRIRNRKSAALMGMLFVSFPTVASTLMFRFTAPPYGLALLLSILAAWILPRTKLGVPLSAIFTALSMGVYQAFVPITISMIVLMLLQRTMEEGESWKRIVRDGFLACLALILGVALYLLCSKLALQRYNTQLTSYQGINTMGQLNPEQLPALIALAYRSVLQLGTEDYCGLSNALLMQIGYRLTAVISIAMIVYTMAAKVRSWIMALLTAGLVLVFPLAVNFIVIMCSGSLIYTMMVYAFVMILCAPLVLCEQLPPASGKWKTISNRILSRTMGASLAMMVFIYGYYANVNYTTLYFTTMQMEHYTNAMVTQVRMAEGFDTEKKWAFIGYIQDPLHNGVWEEGMTYGGNNITRIMLIDTRPFWIRNILGYHIQEASQEEINALSQTEEVKAMPCWPAEGSIQVIGDTVVIKCQELES